MAEILIIDDDPHFRKMLRKTLLRAGHNVLEAQNGKIGVRLGQQARPDLVITDIVMPDKEGIETIIELRRDSPDLKIIAISGGGRLLDSAYSLLMAEKLGAQRSFEKPLDRKELLGAIDELLG